MKINGLQLRTIPSRTHYCNASLLFSVIILISCSVRKLRLHYSKTTLLDKELFLIKNIFKRQCILSIFLYFSLLYKNRKL